MLVTNQKDSQHTKDLYGDMKKMSGIERLRLKNQKPPKKIDLIVKGVCIYWITFVVLAWITFWVKDSIPDTLIQYGLGGGAVELVVTGAIEILRDRRVKKGDDEA